MLKVLYTGIIFLVASCTLSASSIPTSTQCRKIQITHITVEDKKNIIVVNFAIKAEKKCVGTNDKMKLLPFLTNGMDSVWLHPVNIVGKTKAKREKQEQALSKKKVSENWGHVMTNGLMINYTYELTKKMWMNDISLGIDQFLEGCCTEKWIAREILAQNLLYPFDVIK